MVLSGLPAGAGPSSTSSVPAPVGGEAVVDTGGHQQVVAAPDQGARLPPTSSKAVVFPARPGYRTVGRRCRVRANHFLVQLSDKEIYHYDVCMQTHSLSLSLSVRD